MTATLTAETDVSAPVGTVYDQWTQVETFPEYLGAVRSVRRIDEVRSRWSVRIAGVSHDFYADIVDEVPDEHIAWQSTDGVFHAGRVDFSGTPEGTHVRLWMTWEPESVLEHVGGALDVDGAQARRDLERFKRFVENREADGGAEAREEQSGSGHLV